MSPTDAIRTAYEARTPTSAALITRAETVMPAGSSRSFSYFRPYPVVFERGAGSMLWDVDDNRYIDFANNGLSLIHGNAYPPIEEAVASALARGTAWPGTSRPQIEFAEVLSERIDAAERVRFVEHRHRGDDAGGEAGSPSDRQAAAAQVMADTTASTTISRPGSRDQGEIPGRTLLADFGDVESFRASIDEHGDQIAAVILEPVPYTVRVTPPPDGFLKAVEEMAKAAGALFIIDDCLMFRLAVGGSSEQFGLDPDLVCLGKWIGGGFPVGAIGASAEMMEVFDHRRGDARLSRRLLQRQPDRVHGRQGRDRGPDRRADRDHGPARRRARGRDRGGWEEARHRRRRARRRLGVRRLRARPRRRDGKTEPRLSLHLAAINHGVYFGPGGEFAMATPMTDDVVSEAIAGCWTPRSPTSQRDHQPRGGMMEQSSAILATSEASARRSPPSGPASWIHVSGMIGFGDDGKVVAGGVAARDRGDLRLDRADPAARRRRPLPHRPDGRVHADLARLRRVQRRRAPSASATTARQRRSPGRRADARRRDRDRRGRLRAGVVSAAAGPQTEGSRSGVPTPSGGRGRERDPADARLTGSTPPRACARDARAHPDFWPAVIDDLGLRFDEPYERVRRRLAGARVGALVRRRASSTSPRAASIAGPRDAGRGAAL